MLPLLGSVLESTSVLVVLISSGDGMGKGGMPSNDLLGGPKASDGFDCEGADAAAAAARVSVGLAPVIAALSSTNCHGLLLGCIALIISPCLSI
ncbi:MAG: hypothetical protein P0S96_06210 [Simkaniaceae bacterium]|nr:hypothetical protein [Candidatus Sacchlamyda saccharinae]